VIDRVAAGAPVRQLLLVEALAHARHSPGSGRITAPGSSWPRSMGIVQRKRRPTSKVDSMTRIRSEGRGAASITSPVWARRMKDAGVPSFLIE
jgi:hypothetical protein